MKVLQLRWLLAILGVVTGILLSAPATALADAVTMSGVVRDGNGAPVQSATVSLLTADPMIPSAVSSSMTGADGHYVLAAAPGSYRLSVGGSLGFNARGASTFELTANRTQDLVLPLFNLTLNIRDASSGALVNEWVYVNLNTSNAPAFELFPGYSTDPVGWAGSGGGSFNGVVTMHWLAAVATTANLQPGPGSIYPSKLVTLDPITGDTTTNVTLGSGVTMSGVVRDGNGAPVQSATVSLLTADPMIPSAVSSSMTGADGHYVLAAAPGSYRLSVGGSLGFNARGASTFELTANRTQDLVLPLFNLTLNIRDVSSGALVNEWVYVNLNTSNAPAFELFPGYSTDPVGWAGSGGGSFNGVVTMHWLAAVATTANLQPGPGSIYPSKLVTLDPITGDTTTNVTLGSGVTMSGVVRDGNGAPVQSATVSLLTADPMIPSAVSSSMTGADGHYVLAAAPGSYRLSVGGSLGFNARGASTFELTANRTQDLVLPLFNLTLNIRDVSSGALVNEWVYVNLNTSNAPAFELFPGYSTDPVGWAGSGGGSFNGVVTMHWLAAVATTANLQPGPGSIYPSKLVTLDPITGDTTTNVTLGAADTTAPTLIIPGAITAEATGPLGAVLTFTVSATDNVDQTPTVVCSPASGSTFALGTTHVACTATDSTGNHAEASFTVTVRDTTSPVLSGVPASITRDAVGPNGVEASFTPMALDLVDQTPRLTCTPTSGMVFAIGDTSVTCTATDAAGNSATADFVVHVRGAAAQLSDLAAAVSGIGPGTSLADKIAKARAALVAGDSATASTSLRAFVNEASAQIGKALTVDAASPLLAAATQIRAVLG